MALPVLDAFLFVFKNTNQIFVELQLHYPLPPSHDHNNAVLLYFPSYLYVSVILQFL